MPESLSLNSPDKKTTLYRSFIDKISTTDEDKQKNSAIYSGNVAIASSGLGLGYTAVHSITLWDLYENAGEDTAEDIGFFSLLPCMALGLYHAKMLVRKNLLYEKSKERSKDEILALRNSLRDLHKKLNEQHEKLKIKNIIKSNEILPKEEREALNKSIQLIKSEDSRFSADINAEFAKQFEKKYHALIEYNNMQAYFEAFKKTTRTVMLFTILFSLEFAGLGSFSDIMIAALVTGTFAGFLGFRAQDKENAHDIKPRRQYEEQLALNEEYIRLKLLEKYIIEETYTPAQRVKKEYSLNPFSADRNPHIYNTDNALAALCVTSGYMALSWITLFSYNEYMPEDGLYNLLDLAKTVPAEVVLFGIPVLIATIIDGVNIYRNYKLYEFYEDEHYELNEKITKLNTQINALKVKYHLADITRAPSFESIEDKKDRADFALFYKRSEAFKKGLRVLTMTFLFAGSSFIAVGSGLIAVLLVAVLITAADYYWRQKKEQLEQNNSDLRKEVLQLENDKKAYVENIVVETPVETLAHELNNEKKPPEPSQVGNIKNNFALFLQSWGINIPSYLNVDTTDGAFNYSTQELYPSITNSPLLNTRNSNNCLNSSTPQQFIPKLTTATFN